MYAIVAAGGRQEKVGVGDEIEINRVSGEPGSSVDLSAVLLVDDGAVTAGEDLKGASVTAEVVEHLRGPKIRIVHYRNKTGYKRRQGHRQELTRLRVTGIETGS